MKVISTNTKRRRFPGKVKIAKANPAMEFVIRPKATVRVQTKSVLARACGNGLAITFWYACRVRWSGKRACHENGRAYRKMSSLGVKEAATLQASGRRLQRVATANNV